LATGAIGGLGLSGGLLFLVPGILFGALLVFEHGRLTRLAGVERAGETTSAAADQPAAFKLLLAVIALRSIAFYGLFTFVPLFEVARGHSKSYGNTLLSLVLLAGVAGTLC